MPTTAEAAVTAYVGLGANLADPRRQLLSALGHLRDLPRCRLCDHSPLYRTPPLGVPGQPDYVNAVARLQTTLAPLALLDRLQDIEARMGRVRDGVRWGPRVIDLDLLLFGDLSLQHPRLQLPHPEMRHRAFVLVPLADLAPADLAIPGQGPLAGLLEACDRSGMIRIP